MTRSWIGTTVLAFGIATTAQLAASEKFGAGVTLETATPIADLLATPDAYLGKTIRIDGVVEAVCTNMGCWMELKDAASGKSIQAKVDDGVIVFPVSAKGKKASAQGVFEPVSGEHAEGGAEHADHPTAKYWVKATGAVVH